MPAEDACCQLRVSQRPPLRPLGGFLEKPGRTAQVRGSHSPSSGPGGPDLEIFMHASEHLL